MAVTKEQVQAQFEAVVALRGQVDADEQPDLYDYLGGVVERLGIALQHGEFIKKFLVTFYRVVEYQITVEATDEETALEEADNRSEDADLSDDNIAENFELTYGQPLPAAEVEEL